MRIVRERVADRRAVADEDLLDDRLGRDARTRRGERRRSGTSRQPSERLAFLGDDARRTAAATPIARAGVARQEHEARAVAPGRRQVDAERRRDLAEEPVRHLDQDAGAVAGVRLAAAGAAVQQVDEDLQRLRATIACERAALDVDDEPDAAGVVLVRGS